MKRSLRKVIWIFLMFVLTVFSDFTSVRAADTSVLNIFLVQNSGWMEPFYVDANSKFKPIVQMVIEKVTDNEEEVLLASFNQSLDGNISPLIAYRGSDRRSLITALQNVGLAKKPGKNIYADTDFKEAVIGAITQYSPGRPCILWIFTNNKNSPQNSPETSIKNKEFYSWLQNEDNIKRIVAYPFPMPVKGDRFEANGMMIYAMAYGPPADDFLKRLIKSKLPFENQPARLKPLDTDAVTFIPTGYTNTGNFKAALGSDNSALILQFDSSNKPEVAAFKGSFRNDFYPYDIRSANVSLAVNFYGDSHGIQTSIEPHELFSVATGERSGEVSVMIGIPPLPSPWSHPEIIFKSGHQVQADMVFTLSNQQLALSPGFLKLMNELFPGDPLPEIFVPAESSKESITTRSLFVEVVYPIWPLILLALFSMAIIFGGIWLLSTVVRVKKFIVVVDGIQKTYALKAFSECALYSDKGDRIGTLKRGFGKPSSRLANGREEHVNII